MYTLSLEVKLLTPKVAFSGIHYRRLHAYVLRSIQQNNPILSEEIHARKGPTNIFYFGRR